MFFRASFMFFTLLVPHAAFSDYEPQTIKNAVSDNPELFPISNWQQSADGGTWIATTTQKWLEITVNADQTEVISPYINAQHIEAAKARCSALAHSALAIESDMDSQALDKLIEDASQHHKLKSFELNNVRFEVMPKLVGAFVKLFCVVKPAV